MYKPKTCEGFYSYEKDFQLTRNQQLLEIAGFNHNWPSEGKSFVKISKIKDYKNIFSSCIEVLGRHVHGEVISSSSLQPKIIDSVLAKSDVLDTRTLPVYFKHFLALKPRERVLVEVLNGQNLTFAQEITLQVPTQDPFDHRALPSLVKVGMDLPYLVEDVSHLVFAGLFSSTETAKVINIKPTGKAQWYLIDTQTKIKVHVKPNLPYLGNFFSIYKTPSLVIKRSPTLARAIKLISQIGKFSNVAIRGIQGSGKTAVVRAVAWKLGLRFSRGEAKLGSLVFIKEMSKEFLIRRNNQNLVVFAGGIDSLRPEIQKCFVCVDLDLPGLEDRTVLCEHLNNLYRLEINPRELALKTKGRTIQEIIKIFKDIRIFNLSLDYTLGKLPKPDSSVFDLRSDIIGIIRCGFYRGIVLYGDSGKEKLAESIANDLKMNFLRVQASDTGEMFENWSGIVLVEDIDQLLPRNNPRVYLKNKLLSFMAEEQSNLFVIGSTKDPCLVDPSVYTPEGFGAVLSFNSQEETLLVTEERLLREIYANCEGRNSATCKDTDILGCEFKTDLIDKTEDMYGDLSNAETSIDLAP